VLRGRIQDGNGGALAASLDALGVRVTSIRIVGDDLDEIVAAVAGHRAAGTDLICVTGGLGPTHDDLTMEAIARVTDRALAVDASALAMVRARSRGLPVDAPAARAAHVKQASLPAGATVLPPAGTAPGCLVEHDGALIVVLPGPPWELRAMWADAVRDQPALRRLLARASAPPERVLRILARPESQLVEILDGPGAPDRSGLTLGICARDGELELTVRGDPAAAVDMQRHLAGALGAALFSTDGRTVDDIVAAGLTAAGHTVSVAESCTGGGLGARFSARAGASDHFVGGVISYADSVKTDVLGCRGAPSRTTARCRRSARAPWPTACAGSRAAPGPCRSPASPGPAAARTRSPWASCTSAAPDPAARSRGGTNCAATAARCVVPRRPRPCTCCARASPRGDGRRRAPVRPRAHSVTTRCSLSADPATIMATVSGRAPSRGHQP